MISLGDLNTLQAASSYDYGQQSMLSTGLGILGATAVDLGVSIWNSIIPEATGYETTTSKVLQDMGADGALAAYHNNQDLVNTMSFLGGVFIPGGAALKLSQGVRAGMKGTSFLSPVRHKDDLLRYEKLLEDGLQGSRDYTQLRRSMYARGQAENLMDTVAMEVAIIGTFNAHPFMEDYMQNPIKNFGISMAIGGGIGAGLYGIGTRTAIRSVEGATQSAALNRVNESVSLFDTPFSDTAASMANLDLAAKRLDFISDMPAGTPGYNQLTKDIAKSMGASIRGRMTELSTAKSSKDLLEVIKGDKELASTMLGRFADLRFGGTDKFSFFRPSAAGLRPTPTINTTQTPGFRTTDDLGEETFEKTSYYNADLDAFVNKAQAQQLANAADLGLTPTQLLKHGTPLHIKRVQNQFSKDLVGGRTADIEAEWLRNLHFYNKQSTKDLLGAEFVKGDLPALNGWLSAVADRKVALESELTKLNSQMGDAGFDTKMALAKAEELRELKQATVKVYDEDRLQLVDAIEMPDGLPQSFTNANDYVKPTHIDDVLQDIDNGAIQPIIADHIKYPEASEIVSGFYQDIRKAAGVSRMSTLNDIPATKLASLSREWAQAHSDELLGTLSAGTKLSPDTALLMLRWIAGDFADKEVIRTAMASARTLRSGQHTTTPFARELQELLENPAIKAQQDGLRRHADAKGNVYLYRGLATPAAGENAVSSYTFNQKIAKSFAGDAGTANLYKVNVDDIVGFLYRGEQEWLVGTSTRDSFDSLSSARQAGMPAPRRAVQPRKSSNLTEEQLSKHYLGAKGQAIHEELKEGKIPLEVIAARYNTSTDIVSLAGNNPDIYGFMANAWGRDGLMSQANRWSSAGQVEEALSPVRRTMQLTAREDQHLGTAGELLRKQRDAILGRANLDTQMKTALNNADTLAQERIKAKVSNIDDMFADLNTQWVEASVAASNSGIAKNILDNVINSGELKTLREGLHQFVNGKGGNPLYSSGDFITRNMEEVGPLITAIGDKLTHYSNAASEKLLTPIATQFRKLHHDDAARTELAILDNLRQSTPGHMEYDDSLRKLVTHTRDPETGAILSTVEHSEEIMSPVVRSIMQQAQQTGEELYSMQTVLNRLGGRDKPASIGLWIPSTNLKNKEYAYVNNLDDRTQKMLVGNNVAELEEAIAAYKPAANERIVRRSEAAAENKSFFQPDLEKLTAADINLQKRGIGQAVPDLSPQRLDDIITGYRDRIVAQTTAMFELSAHDLVKKLEYVSDFNTRAISNRNQQGWRKLTSSLTTRDTAADIKDLLLGRNPAYRNEFMGSVNAVGDSVLQGVSTGFNRVWETVRPVGKGAQVDYDKYTALRQAAGIPNPFEVFEEAARPGMLERARTMGVANPNRVVQIGNELATTLALKFGEIAQPIVNMLSLPILMSSTVSRSVRAQSISNPEQLLEAGSLSVMTGGLRRAVNPPLADRAIMTMAESEGLFSPILSEVDAVIKLSKFSSGGAGASIDKALNSKFVEVMSQPSLITETYVRKVAFTTGVEMARRLYGNTASDAQVMIFARDFLKQSIGNYSTSQRPMLFQGSVGAAMGLFQTYMLTFAQNTYRHLELKDYKGLGKMMLAQGGIFGAGSLPGFQPISEAIANNFSDDNFDLTTGTYRALPDPLASLLIYGMPSNLGPALYTRGDIAPRVPTGFDTMVAPSMVGQVLTSLVNAGKSITATDVGVGQAFFEALSTQSVSRPIARLSELATGHAITGAGQQMMGPEEVWSWQGITSRLLSTRGLRESKLREATHLNSAYGAIDRENRQAIVNRLRTAIRNDTLTNDMMDSAALEYMRTGSPQGFRSAINQAFMDNQESVVEKARARFKDSPLMLIVDDLD